MDESSQARSPCTTEAGRVRAAGAAGPSATSKATPASAEKAADESPAASFARSACAVAPTATRRTRPSPQGEKTRPPSTKEPMTTPAVASASESPLAKASSTGASCTSQLTIGTPAARRMASGHWAASAAWSSVVPAFSAESGSAAGWGPSARAGEEASTPPPAFCRQGVKGRQAERQGKGQAGASEGAREARRGATAAARASHCGCSLPDRKQVFPYPSRPLGRIPGPHRTARTLAWAILGRQGTLTRRAASHPTQGDRTAALRPWQPMPMARALRCPSGAHTATQPRAPRGKAERHLLNPFSSYASFPEDRSCTTMVAVRPTISTAFKSSSKPYLRPYLWLVIQKQGRRYGIRTPLLPY